MLSKNIISQLFYIIMYVFVNFDLFEVWIKISFLLEIGNLS